MSTHTPRLPQKEEHHPCPLCYRPMTDLTCALHGAMEWCRIHKAAYPPGTHQCEPSKPQKTPQRRKPKSNGKRTWPKKPSKRKYPLAYCIVCGIEVSRGGPQTHFCGKHRKMYYGRFRYMTTRREIQAGLPNIPIPEAIERIRQIALGNGRP